MEISKAMQEEILSVQNKLKNAIRDHQICVVKLKDDPNNADILDRIREIQLHIVSLGRWQKQVVQRLRKEVERYKAENSLNGTKFSLASLLGLNNNNHMTNNIEASRRFERPLVNGHPESRAASKEDYEEIVRNGDLASPDNEAVKERRSSSVESASGEEEAAREPSSPEATAELDGPALTAQEQQCFLGRLGLITSARLVELQNKRSERKRRSTAGSHFVYSSWELPTKRKRHAYLQSLGSAPQTRQTTARLNGPSPPPAPARGAKSGGRAKSLIQPSPSKSANASGAKPNILRNGDGKSAKEGRSLKQEPASPPPAKLAPTTSTGKTVHIPGLPSCLTVERIENDSTVCVTCRNPGTLTVCEYCTAKFHVSCHTTSPASSCYCPKCAARLRAKSLTTHELEILRLEVKGAKKEKETVTAAYSQRAFGKAGEDSEVHKAPGGLYKVDAAQARQIFNAASLGINQLPSSTYLFPIAASSPVGSSSAAAAAASLHDVTFTALDEVVLTNSTSNESPGVPAASRLNHDVGEQKLQQSQQQSSILLSQLSQSKAVTVDPEPRLLRKGQEVVNHGQSILLIEKVPGQSIGQRRWSAERPIKPKPTVSVLSYEWQGRSTAGIESRQSGFTVGKSDNYVTVEVICNEDSSSNRAEFSADNSVDNSADCVYVSESSSGAPDADTEQSRVDESKKKEPEVFNISSGSSELCTEPLAESTGKPEQLDSSVEQLDTSGESADSVESPSAITTHADDSDELGAEESEALGAQDAEESAAPDAEEPTIDDGEEHASDDAEESRVEELDEPQVGVSDELRAEEADDSRADEADESRADEADESRAAEADESRADVADGPGANVDGDEDFLYTVFPGSYGYKIDVIDMPASASRESTPGAVRDADEHVKLEEADLAASPRTELSAATASEVAAMEVDDDDGPTTVPDNKSDDGAAEPMSEEPASEPPAQEQLVDSPVDECSAEATENTVD